MRAVVVGDLHLDALRKHFGQDSIDYQIFEVRKAYDYAVKHDIRHVIHQGDVSDKSHLSRYANSQFVALLHEYSVAGVHSHVIKGNHDVEHKEEHSLKPMETLIESGMLKGVTVYSDPKLVMVDGVPCYFAPFPCHKGITEVSKGFGHFEVEGSTRDNGMVCTVGKLDSSESNTIWDLGHLHTPHIVGDKYHYTGTLYQMNFGESLPKFFTDLNVRYENDKLDITRERIPNDPEFKFFNIEVYSIDDLAGVSDNPKYLYKLFLQQDVVLPANYQLKHDNVVDVVKFKNKDELIKLQAIGNEDYSAMFKDITDGLDPYLADNCSFTDEQYELSRGIMDEIVEKLGLQPVDVAVEEPTVYEDKPKKKSKKKKNKDKT